MLQDPEHVVAAQIGQDDVEQHEIGPLDTRDVERLHAALDAQQPVARPQRHLDHGAEIGVVVDQEDRRASRRPCLGAVGGFRGQSPAG